MSRCYAKITTKQHEIPLGLATHGPNLLLFKGYTLVIHQTTFWPYGFNITAAGAVDREFTYSLVLFGHPRGAPTPPGGLLKWPWVPCWDWGVYLRHQSGSSTVNNRQNTIFGTLRVCPGFPGIDVTGRCSEPPFTRAGCQDDGS